jgi:hypothetical protein
MTQAYRETVVRRQIPMSAVESVDYSKVSVVLGKVRQGKVDVQEALDDARELGWRDLREKYRIPTTDVPDPRDYDGGDDEDDEFTGPSAGTSDLQGEDAAEALNGSQAVVIDVEPNDESEDEPTQNAVGVLSTFAVGQRVAAFLVWVQAEMAPEHKKRMGADRRATLQALIEACRDEGWLDAND